VPDHDVHTEHDPREPFLGHAGVDDGALADPDTEPVADDTPADASATTYESAGHNGHDAPDDSSMVDRSFGRDTVFGAGNESTVEDAGGEPQTEEPADEAPVDEAPVDEAASLTYTSDVADLPEHPDDEHPDYEHPDDEHAAADQAEVDADAGVAAALPVHPEAGTPENQALKPGAAETTPLGKLWADADVDGMRARWRELQLKFIDDPQAVAGDAESLVTEAVDKLAAALNARKDELSDWRGAEDTERLRAAVRRYRDLFDQLLDL
jgi:hypothetical protein